MLLVIDVGNTHMVVGIFREGTLLRNWRISTDLRKTEDEFAMIFKSLLTEWDWDYSVIHAITISCVVPPLVWILKKMSREYFKVEPILVNSNISLNIHIDTDYPNEVGADRIVNAVATQELYGSPAIIIDYGTATTVCALKKNGIYSGGAIAPGLELASHALFEKTSKLPEVELIDPVKAIGRNTVQAIQSGVYLGHIGLTKELVYRFAKEIDGNPKVIATGGMATLIAKDCPVIDVVDPLLTLKGLKIIDQLNNKSKDN